MGYLAGWQPEGLRMVRQRILFDRTPGEQEPIDFVFDILSEEYGVLWPGGEARCQELKVFHNPVAEHPIARSICCRAPRIGSNPKTLGNAWRSSGTAEQ